MRSAWRTSRPTARGRAPRSRSTSAARSAPPRCGRSRSTSTRRAEPVAGASYPDDLKYHADHDWARVDGETATLGISWYAQDQLGEVVYFDPPDVGTSITKDEPYAEVESVKAVSDVIAPVSGEILEVISGISAKPE